MIRSAIIVIWIFLLSCNNGNYSAKGTVKRIEIGKDGYTAILVTENGDSVSATISMVNMGMRYKDVKVGDKVKVYGDSMYLGGMISITATKIVE